MTAVVTLQHMASAVVLRTLLDYKDQHSPECKAKADKLIAKLQTNLYSAVSTDLLDLYVDSYPRQLPAFLLPVLAPPHLRTLKLKGCLLLERDSQLEYKHLKEMFIKCSKLRSLILDGCNFTSPLLLADVITQHASQLTYISLEECRWVTDEFIQKILRGLLNLSYLNISVCPEVTDRVFALTDTQGLLEESNASQDFAFRCNLSSVDLSGNQQLTSTCIRHLTELCGPKLRNVSVAATRMDCTILWFLSGYSLSTAIQLAVEANEAIMNVDLASRETVSQLISEFRGLQDRLKNLQGDQCQKQANDKREENEDKMQDAKDLKVKLDDGEDDKGGNMMERPCDNEACECFDDTYKPLEVDKKELQTRGGYHWKAENEAEYVKESTADHEEGIQQTSRTNGYCEIREIPQPDTERQTTDAQHNKMEEEIKYMESHKQMMQEIDRISVITTAHMKGKQQYVTDNIEAFSSFQDKYNVKKELEVQRCKDRGLHDAGRNHVKEAKLRMGIGFVQTSKDAEMLYRVEGRTEKKSWSENKGGSQLISVYDDHDATDEVNDQSVEDDSKEKLDPEDWFAKSSKDRLDAQLELFVSDVIKDSCKRLHWKDVTRQLSSFNQSEAPGIDTSHEASITSQSLKDAILMKSGMETKKQCMKCKELLEATDESRQENPSHQQDIKEVISQDEMDNNFFVSEKTVASPQNCVSSCTNATNQSSGECCSCGCVLYIKRSDETCLDKLTTDKHCKPVQKIVSCAGSDDSPCTFAPVKGSTGTASSSRSGDMISENKCSDLLQAVSASEDANCLDVNCVCKYSCGIHHPSTRQSRDAGPVSACKSSKAGSASGSDCKGAQIARTAKEMPGSKMNAVSTWRRLYMPCILSLDMSIIDFDATLVMTCLQEFLRANTHLKKLNVSWKELTDSLLEIIATGAELQSLCLIDCSRLTSLGVANLLNRCKNLQHLDLQGVCFIADAALMPLFMDGYSCNIQSLNLSETNITDATLTHIAELLGKKITTLEISWCEEISDFGLAKIAKHCTSLQTIAFRQCSASADTLMSLAWNCTNLTALNISGAENLTDGVVEAMMPSLRLLAKLDVSWNSDLTNTAICCIMSCCPLLVELYLMGLKRITERPFMPMISELGQWQRCKRLIQLKMKERMLLKKLGEEHLSSDEEYEDLFCPVRSTSYAPCLRMLELQYCDLVDDDLLAELVAICIGQLAVTDYYGMQIQPKLLRSKVVNVPVTP